jgi:hypothetical protein
MICFSNTQHTTPQPEGPTFDPYRGNHAVQFNRQTFFEGTAPSLASQLGTTPLIHLFFPNQKLLGSKAVPFGWNPRLSRTDLLNGDAGEVGSVGLGPSLQISLNGTGGATETILGRDTLDTVERVDVLVENNLVASGTALARNDGRVGKEELPDLFASQY